MQKITQEFLQQGANGPGGWNREQLALLGVDWPPQSGWRNRLIGKWISPATVKRFLELKGRSKKARRDDKTKVKGWNPAREMKKQREWYKRKEALFYSFRIRKTPTRGER